MQFTPTAQTHADQAATAIEAGDWAAAEDHLNAAADTSPDDALILGAAIHATRQHNR